MKLDTVVFGQRDLHVHHRFSFSRIRQRTRLSEKLSHDGTIYVV